jgi:hypothetical protein
MRLLFIDRHLLYIGVLYSMFDCTRKDCHRKLEDTKGVIRSRKSIQLQKEKTPKGLTMDCKTLLRRLKIDQHDTGGELMCSWSGSSFWSINGIVMLLLSQIRWYGMNEERTGLWLRHTKHICGHLWQKYFVAINHFNTTTTNALVSVVS